MTRLEARTTGRATVVGLYALYCIYERAADAHSAFSRFTRCLNQARRYQELDVRSLLLEAGLLGAPGGAGGGGPRRLVAGGLSVTQRGFQFLLQPSDRQLWAVLREYISGAEAA